jgi:very-short-patch-repair endonuclease
MGQKLHKEAPPKNFYYSRQNRQGATKAEEVLWAHLRNGKMHEVKFRRQHPISDFIADFYSYECKLIIELDGEYHSTNEQWQYDEGRTFELKELKIKVIRFTNREVLENIAFVLDEIGAQVLEIFYENEK